MKRITLISLPSPFLYEPAMNPPIGLCSIGTVCKEAGHDVKVIDYATLDYDYDGLEYLHHIKADSDIYGISCVSAQFRWLKEVIKWIKTINKKAFVVVGGPHASSEPESCLNAGADIAFNGEGDFGFLEIVNGNHWTDGACFKYQGDLVLRDRVFVDDLKSLPLPDFGLFDMDRYKRRLEGEKAFHIMTLRGCPYRCHFCDSSAIGGKVRYFDPEKIIAWMDGIIDKYGIKNFVIYDDVFTTSPKRVKYFCKEFKKRGIKWRCWSRANLIKEDLLIEMRDSGLESVAIGIESGDQTVLNNINKRISVEKNKKAIQICKKVGVPVRCSLIYGSPGETRETLQNTIDFIKETQPDEWNLSILMPTPGSQFWENPKKHGLSFNKDEIVNNDYLDLNRCGDSAMGNISITIDTMEQADMIGNLNWFVDQLDLVSPRKKIRDTIQDLKPEEL